MLTGDKIYREVNKGNITIEPFNLDNLNPNSYNVCLSNKIKAYDKNAVLDLKRNNDYFREIIIPEEGMILLPNTLYIASTKEVIGSDKYISAIDGRSSIGRLGMQIHLTAGFGDLGFHGTYTLEITVVQPIRIYPNFPVAQVYFEKPYGNKKFLYHGRYQNQNGPTTSRSDINSKEIKNYHYK